MKKKLFMMLLMGCMILSSNAVVYAASSYTNSTENVDETQEVSNDGTATTDVYATVGSQFKVIAPKKITLGGASKTGAYTISLEGEWAGNEIVKVVPHSSFLMKSEGKTDVTATVVQDKTEWLFSEVSTVGNGTISAPGLTAGLWAGQFTFMISLESLPTN